MCNLKVLNFIRRIKSALALKVLTWINLVTISFTLLLAMLSACVYSQEVKFREAHATRGQDLYYTHCISCHGEALSGFDQAPALAGPKFFSSWQKASLQSLVSKMSSMPPDQPESLLQSQLVDILTYILWFNEFPMGHDELTDDPKKLNEIYFCIKEC